MGQEKNLHSTPTASTSNLQCNVSSPSHSSSPSEKPEEEYLQPKSHPKGPHSLIKFPRYALKLVRGDISSNLGASLANTLLLNLKAMGLLIPNININDIIIDKCKVDRAKTKVKTTTQQKYDQSMENLMCIAVDGSMDKDTLLYKEICGGKWTENYEKTKGPEHHLTFTKETPYESKYLTQSSS